MEGRGPALLKKVDAGIGVGAAFVHADADGLVHRDEAEGLKEDVGEFVEKRAKFHAPILAPGGIGTLSAPV